MTWLSKVSLSTYRRNRRRQLPLVWEIRVTSPDGNLVEIDTEALYHVWRFGSRSTDGYLDIAQMPRLHIWVKPRGWEEPDSRLEALDGTGVLLPGPWTNGR